MGKNEDYGLGGRILDSSEKLPLYIYMILVKEVCVVKSTLWEKLPAHLVKVTASHEEQMAPLMISVLF